MVMQIPYEFQKAWLATKLKGLALPFGCVMGADDGYSGTCRASFKYNYHHLAIHPPNHSPQSVISVAIVLQLVVIKYADR